MVTAVPSTLTVNANASPLPVVSTYAVSPRQPRPVGLCVFMNAVRPRVNATAFSVPSNMGPVRASMRSNQKSSPGDVPAPAAWSAANTRAR